MRITRWILGAAIALAAVLPGRLQSQGVTTGAISGTVTNGQGQPIEGARVVVRNSSTGASAGTLVRADGRYFVQGLETGGPYAVTARRIGFAPQTTEGVFVALGSNVRVDFKLAAQAAQLSEVTVTGQAQSAIISSAHKGTVTTISDSSVSRLPTLNRNFTDFVVLSPQISTKGPGNSAAGQNNRYNAIQIDGSVGNDLFGLGSTGQPGGQAGAKQVPLAAVKEYQVLLSPYDVRQGNFTGALVNAVTKSGSNEFHGEVFGVTRNEKLERDVAYLRDAPFKQSQYGFWVGGPIIRDKLQFSIAPEFQTQSAPASGPYAGQPADLTPLVPIDATNQDRFCKALVTQYGYSSCGNFGLVSNENPLSNLFARFDVLNLPMNSRAIVRYNYAGAEQNTFSRSQFSLRDGANGFNFISKTNNGLAQLFTNFAGGSSNELLVGVTRIRDQRVTSINAPQVTVSRVPGAAGTTGTAALVAGTENSSQGNALDQDIFEFTDNFTFPVGSHRFTIGTKNEFFKVRNIFSQNSLGNYFFGTLDSLESGKPNNVTLGVKVNPADPSDGAARFNARTLGFYAEDEWQATSNLSVQYGLRLDVPSLTSQPGTNPLILSALGINTADVPKNVLQFSPRFGFNWDVTGDQVNQLRGGAGVFVGRPAYVWLSNLFGNSGVSGFGNLVCNTPARSPAFPGANGSVPTNCVGATGSPAIVLNTVDPKLKFPQIMRASLGFDRRLPGDVIATVQGLYTKAIQNFFYNNLGLADPTTTDSHGRVLYGDVVAGNTATNFRPGLADVINLTNQSKDYSYSATGQLQKKFSNNFEGQLAYTYGHSYDVASLTSSVAASNFQFGRSVKGNLNEQDLTISKFDSPHRIIGHGTYSFPSRTDFSFIYSAESGVPFDFTYFGDMNGDNQRSNDLIYVPLDARNPSEIVFQPNGAVTVAQQQDAFENFINNNECLRTQRGTIMNRNTCRTPWSRRLDADIRQSLPTIRGQNFLLQLDIYNVLNLLNKAWGAQDLGSTNSQTILTRRAFTPGQLSTGAQGIYNFSPTFSQFNTQNISSNYALQLQLKYTF